MESPSSWLPAALAAEEGDLSILAATALPPLVVKGCSPSDRQVKPRSSPETRSHSSAAEEPERGGASMGVSSRLSRQVKVAARLSMPRWMAPGPT